MEKQYNRNNKHPGIYEMVECEVRPGEKVPLWNFYGRMIGPHSTPHKRAGALSTLAEGAGLPKAVLQGIIWMNTARLADCALDPNLTGFVDQVLRHVGEASAKKVEAAA